MRLRLLASLWQAVDRTSRADRQQANRLAVALEDTAKAYWQVPYAQLVAVRDGRLVFFCGGHGGWRTVLIDELCSFQEDDDG